MPSNKGWLSLDGSDNSYTFSYFDLSWKQRLLGFAVCFAGGIISQVIAAILLFTTTLLSLFGILFVLGVTLSLVSSGFLVGFGKQLKGMLKPIRLGATLIFLASVVVVCICSFWLRNPILTIVFVIIELLAYAWYSITYIPYAQSAISKLFSKIIP